MAATRAESAILSDAGEIGTREVAEAKKEIRADAG
jgi:hypothetical protein